jgi:hypothetical protein
MLEYLPLLHTLHIGALGGGTGTAARLGNTSALILNDYDLEDLTELLAESCPNLENVVLAGNARLAKTVMPSPGYRPIADFITRVGRRCKVSDTFSCRPVLC